VHDSSFTVKKKKDPFASSIIDIKIRERGFIQGEKGPGFFGKTIYKKEIANLFDINLEIFFL
jgi:hypothetical protein